MVLSINVNIVFFDFYFKCAPLSLILDLLFCVKLSFWRHIYIPQVMLDPPTPLNSSANLIALDFGKGKLFFKSLTFE